MASDDGPTGGSTAVRDDGPTGGNSAVRDDGPTGGTSAAGGDVSVPVVVAPAANVADVNPAGGKPGVAAPTKKAADGKKLKKPDDGKLDVGRPKKAKGKGKAGKGGKGKAGKGGKAKTKGKGKAKLKKEAIAIGSDDAVVMKRPARGKQASVVKKRPF